jgi:hypothetical protein
VLAFPRMDCGLDGHAWASVETLIRRAFAGSGILIVVVTRWVDIPRFNPHAAVPGGTATREGRVDGLGLGGPRAFDPGLASLSSGERTTVIFVRVQLGVLLLVRATGENRKRMPTIAGVQPARMAFAVPVATGATWRSFF